MQIELKLDLLHEVSINQSINQSIYLRHDKATETRN